MSEHLHHVADALHVHGQEHPHDPVFIVGPSEQLELLRRAIDQAIAGEPQSASFFTADGEGYRLVVVPVADTRDAMLPYADEPSPGGWAGVAPHEHLGRESYRTLLRGEPTVAEEGKPCDMTPEPRTLEQCEPERAYYAVQLGRAGECQRWGCWFAQRNAAMKRAAQDFEAGPKPSRMEDPCPT